MSEYSNGPYINTVLDATVSIKPNQMNNRIYKNIKDNLIAQLEKKCHRDYGFITKIYEVTKRSDAYIIPENPTASANINVSFTCRLCHPLRNKQIICKIEKLNNMLINAQNGPITVIITMNSLNQAVFFHNIKENKLMAKTGGKTIEVTQGTFVKVTITSKQFNDQDTVILATGEMNDVVTDDEEIKKAYMDEYLSENTIMFSKYIENKVKPETITPVIRSDTGTSETSVSSEIMETKEPPKVKK